MTASAQSGYTYDVFLSYNSAQAKFADRLDKDLRAKGLVVWYAPRSLHGGEVGSVGMERGIAESRHMVAVLSPEYLDAEWTNYELQINTVFSPSNRDRRLIPILHTQCKLPARLQQFTYIDFTDTHGDEQRYQFRLAQLLSDLRPDRFQRPVDFESFCASLADQNPDAIPEPGPLPAGSRMSHGRNAQFVGREEELRKLAKALTPGSMTTVGVHAAVTGMGGVGKTQLAIEYAHRYGRLYEGGVFWLNMESAETAMNEVALCGGPEGMKLEGFDKLTLPDQAAEVERIWRDGKARLVVFDNAEKDEVVETWRPKTGRCALVITSRRDDWPPELGVRSLPVETLPREKSLEMLAKARPVIATDAAQRKITDAICEQLGDLPIALSVAADFLRKHPSERLEEYSEAVAAQPKAPEESLEKVWACFSVSYDKLDPKSATDALAMRLFHLASHFAPVSINPMLLAASAKLNWEKRKDCRAFDEAVGRLRGLGLVSVEPDGRLLLHRLLRQFALQRPLAIATTERTLQVIAETFITFARVEIEGGLPQKLAGEVVHMREVATALFERGEGLGAALFNCMGIHFRKVAAFEVSRSYLQLAVSFAEAEYGADNPTTAVALNNLGSLLEDKGDYAGARQCFERALTIQESTLGSDHQHVATTTNNLGVLCKKLGELATARQYFGRALVILEKSAEPRNARLGTTINNLGSLALQRGDLAEARRHLQRALELEEATNGPNHPRVATAVSNMGALLKELGLPGEAVPCFERALKIDETHLGKNHPTVAVRLTNLGVVLGDLGDFRTAKQCCDRALRIVETHHGPEHPDLAPILSNLGGLLFKSGDLEGARKCVGRALKIAREVFGEEHPDTRRYRENMEKCR